MGSFTLRAALFLAGLLLATGCEKPSGRNSSGDSPTPAQREPRLVVANPKNNAEGPNPAVVEHFSVPLPGGSAQRETRQPVDDRYPFPQDMTKAAKLRNERLAAYKKATVEVFDRTAGAKAPWADVARKAMEAYCRRTARQQLTSYGVEHQDFVAAVKATMRTKCDDPLIRYWQTRFGVQNDPDRVWENIPRTTLAEGFRGVLDQLPNNPYPPTIRVHLAWNTLVNFKWLNEQTPGAVKKDEIAAVEKIFWRTFEELAELSDPLAQQELFLLAERVESTTKQVWGGGDSEVAWRKIDHILAKKGAAEWVRLTIEGYFLIQAAWHARGGGYADTVRPERWKLFGQRLQLAREKLERSWEIKPSFPWTASLMITVAMGLSLGRDEMETWFRRAMEADPDFLPACHAKIIYLQPKWHGTPEDLVAFNYQCYRTKNWYAHFPMVLDWTCYGEGQAIFPIGRSLERYYQDDQTWEDIKALYLGYLAEYPDDRWARTRFAVILITADQSHLAAAHFEALGNRAWAPVFPSQAKYEEYKTKALQAAQMK